MPPPPSSHFPQKISFCEYFFSKRGLIYSVKLEVTWALCLSLTKNLLCQHFLCIEPNLHVSIYSEISRLHYIKRRNHDTLHDLQLKNLLDAVCSAESSQRVLP